MSMKIREAVKTLRPYQWEPSTDELSKKLGLRKEQVLRFDTNTMPSPPKELLSKLAELLPGLGVNDYPDTSYTQLREGLAKYLGRRVEQLTVTTGADEALDIVAKTFIDPGTEALASKPTYSFYSTIVEVMGGRLVLAPRREDFSEDVDALLEACSRQTRLVFICSPNNPTGNLTDRSDIMKVLEESGCPLVVDESYAEFCGRTVVDLVDAYENLIVIRTFSKAFSLAGARVGYMVAHEKTVRLLNKVRPPNSLSVISLALAGLALENLELLRRNVQWVTEERERLIKALQVIPGLQVYPSQANFILIRFKTPPAPEAYRRLLQQGIVPRSFDEASGLGDCLRFCVRTPEENQALINALERLVTERL
ncbi:histidinol-phosphate transaminase [Candidatus Hecatella orcuttiae]|jgi:histidinol-phosphate aminotransferase|uniref:histidinol-phosphate transaminase n=1 Tax=Candidatus Hecatella orcuttiae TaxID=1935119 RepID=UPI002867F54D|nr:histidinol-phosphate transaminase [Candidatus Hecatella orcuttiae]